MPHPLAVEVVRLLIDRGLTTASAETDTGGLIGSWFTDVPGSSKTFRGGATPYANPPKEKLLGVPHHTLVAEGSVSEATVLALAQGVRAAFAVDIALAESGITGPSGGSESNPVGTVWIACLGPGTRCVTERRVWSGDREANKHATVLRAFALIQAAATDG